MLSVGPQSTRTRLDTFTLLYTSMLYYLLFLLTFPEALPPLYSVQLVLLHSLTGLGLALLKQKKLGHLLAEQPVETACGVVTCWFLA